MWCHRLWNVKELCITGCWYKQREGNGKIQVFWESAFFIILLLPFFELSLTIPACVSGRSLSWELEDFNCFWSLFKWQILYFSVLNFLKFSKTENFVSFVVTIKIKIKRNLCCHSFANWKPCYYFVRLLLINMNMRWH